MRDVIANDARWRPFPLDGGRCHCEAMTDEGEAVASSVRSRRRNPSSALRSREGHLLPQAEKGARHPCCACGAVKERKDTGAGGPILILLAGRPAPMCGDLCPLRPASSAPQAPLPARDLRHGTRRPPLSGREWVVYIGISSACQATGTKHAIREVLLSGPSEHTRARVAVPDGPGLGIEVDRAALERFRVE
jgi:hypothetical protein